MCCLMLMAIAGHTMAQTTGGQFVIKTGTGDDTHYLSHANNTIGDATAFSPNCLWTSDNTHTTGGTNKNYYYYDGTNYRFLAAPQFSAGGQLTLSTSLPPTNYLNNPESQYYFYKWDNGLGRGVQYYGVDSTYCVATLHHGWDERSDQCWEVYWVSYYENTWKLSEESYEITSYGGKFYAVAVTEHGQDTTTVSGGLSSLQGFEMEYQTPVADNGHQVIPSISDYQYAVRQAYTTYVFDGGTHNYYDNGQGGGAMDHGETVPSSQNSFVNNVSDASFSWTISGDGADYLSFDSESSVLTSTAAQPTVYYITANNTGHISATLTLTVTYADGSKQRQSTTILVKTPCQNPPVMAGEEVVTYVGVTVSWHPTAESYKVSWKKTSASTWNSRDVGDVTSYTITGLDYESTYQYKVQATSCTTGDPTEPYPTFTTLDEPGLMVTGAIFGGGRMANVTGKTEVVIVNCDSVGTIFGGNDIAGSVLGADGSIITLGVNGSGGTTGAINIGSVYGGGNGYYSYGSTDFTPVTANTVTLPEDASIYALSQANEWDTPVWTNTSGTSTTLTIPSITKTSITVTNDYIKVDSLFGGAKNAYLTNDSGNGSSITIDGGTIFAVFGGNNVGGGQGYAEHYIEVNKTTINLVPNIVNTATHGYGRDFGICYLFGGGNKVVGSTTNILISGGQLDTVFAGGNSADVYYANVEVNCELSGVSGTSNYTFGNTYTNAIDPSHYTSGVIGENTLYSNYGWDGVSGIYNVRTLFGGNNMDEMTRVPNITLTSGSIGTVYGGGNKGDMMGLATDDGTGHNLHINNNDVKYSTHVVMNSNQILVDYLYGGCRMSNVANSTWVELKKGHVGTVYGGCNISGDVGSTRVDPNAPNVPTTLEEQAVLGATYVVAGVGDVLGVSNTDFIVYKDLFAGGNGYYHCNNGIQYIAGVNFTNQNYVGKTIPTHNETNVIVHKGITVKGNVYAGGNLAPVGFDDNLGFTRGFPELVGLASVRMDGGMVEQNVYGGGNMASIFGSNEVRVSGGEITLALYGGNDRAGQVAEKTNRVLHPDYTVASDGETNLETLGVKTYVGVGGDAQIGTVYGGGNGDYVYGGETGIQYCGTTPDYPIQAFTFVDVNITGGTISNGGGHIGTVYGGGNGITVRKGVTVFLNVDEPEGAYNFNNVDTIFGGNNKGDLGVVPDILLVHGQVGTVYGGCNRGAMVAASDSLKIIGGYDNIGSYVRLLNEYRPNGTGTAVTPTAKVTEAVYGGCRMNGVLHNSLVLVDGGDFSAVPLFGGSDISGTVGGFSRVAVTGGTVGKVYGGGNGNYYYADDHHVYKIDDHSALVASNGNDDPAITAPICAQSGADILGGSVGTAALLDDGTVSQVFGGGYGEKTETTGNVIVNIGRINAASLAACPAIYGDIYGGSAFGDVNTNDVSGGTVTTSTTVNLFNGTLHSVTETVGGFEVHHGGNVYGGGLGRKEDTGVTAIAAKVYGKVYVNVSSEDQDPENCYLNLREANIFGCNNANGSPQDDVVVHVWRTADTIGEYNSQSGSLYAIRQVFGGGNQADYTPTGKKTLVYVHDCRNTIKRVFSGGNAAAATGVSAIIEGGRFDYIFGGGNGEVSAANIGAGGTDLTVSAGIINHLFGGSNLQGEITGPVNTDVNGDNMGSACAETINEFFGGSNEAGLEADVYTLIECGSGLIGDMYGGSNKANITGNVRLDVRGGSFTNVYGGSKGVLNGTAANITGNVTLNLEGGTIVNAYGGNNQNGNITGKITVNVVDYELEDCELDLTNVYGGGNLASYSPTNYAQDGPVVNVMHIKQAGTQQVQGVKGNVFGGGNQAQVNAHTKVNIGYNATTMSGYLPDDLNTASHQPNTANFHAYVTGNVYGGGNEAGIGYKDEQEQLHGGNTYINVYNGEVCQHIASGEQSVGIYGGCNTTGTVLGNSRVTLLGGTVGNSTTRANIHGGGFGSATLVEGNVTVTFGEVIYDNSGASPVEVHTDEPILYGDLYGGSALGHVNHNNSQTTTVHILNGEITGVPDPGDIQAQYGNVFGGGLGNADHAALVKGRVYVYIGACDTPPSSDLSGQAKLDKCNVFGCNNKNGSPQDDVEVHVYKTYQIAGTNTFNDDDYAVLRTFGGGNESNYAPENNNPNSQKKTHVYVHSCDNTIKYVYGGSNAAAAVGVQTLIEGGRFREIYGGGNGTSIPANIGLGGIGINVNGGYASYYFEGCNHLGTIAGPINQPRPSFPEGYTVCSGSLVIDSYYFGDNEAEHFGDLVGEITCDQASHFNFKNVFAGSRWAIVYGDIKLTVKGGNIEYLFGGSQGYIEDNYPADVRRFPSLAEIEDMNALHPGYYSQKLIDTVTNNPSLIGTGGNIVLVVQGGTIGDVIGGCQELGNVEGKITVIIDALDNTDCPLVIGNVYGASLQTDYSPTNDDTHHAYFEPGTANAVPTPQIKILKGTVGSDSPVTFNVTGNVHQMEGNVYGGGDIGNVTANPKVIIGDSSNTSPVEIKGNVYGGGKDGSVDGSPEVIIVPINHSLTITQPNTSDGVIRVTDRQGNTINSGATIDEYQDLNLVAIPSAYGKKLDKWVVTNGSVLFEKSVNTMFTMGTANASITATFTTVDTYSLNVTHQGEGSVSVTDAQGNDWTGAAIGVGAVLNIVATPTPNSGYTFLRWEVVGTGSTVANANSATTTFTMGTANTTLKAVFVPTHQLTIATPEHGTITVTDIHGQTVTSGAYIGEGALLNIVAHPANTYEFTSWTVTNGTVTDATAISTTFVMGTASGGASISATFHEQPNP